MVLTRGGALGARFGDNAHSFPAASVAMLDPALLRTHPADLAERLRASRGFELDVGQLESLEAQRKQLYLERIVQPSLPRKPAPDVD